MNNTSQWARGLGLVALARTVEKLDVKRGRTNIAFNDRLDKIQRKQEARNDALVKAHNDVLAAFDADLLTAREALHAASEHGGGE